MSLRDKIKFVPRKVNTIKLISKDKTKKDITFVPRKKPDITLTKKKTNFIKNPRNVA